MKKIFALGIGLSFIVSAFVFGSFATYPIIQEITPIPASSATTTPSYTFFSTQAGTITYAGTCQNGDLLEATPGNNTFTYTLVDGVTYSNCAIRIVTNEGKGSNILAINEFTINVPDAPVLTEVTPIPSIALTETPNYTFHSTQQGTLLYGGDCGNGSLSSGMAGNNTTTYNLQDEYIYPACSVTLTNSLGQVSNTLTMDSFAVNVPQNAPIITEVLPIPNPSTITNPNYTFSSTQAGTIVYGGACGSANKSSAVVGNTTATYSLENGQTYSDCTVQITNGNGDSNILSLGTFTVSTGSNAPVLTEVTPIPNPSTTTTPSYTFHSTQAGTIQFGGSCGDGIPATAIVGNNTVTYSLNNGQTYSNCQIRVVNANIEASNILALGTFTVRTGSNAPVITEVAPISNPSTTTTPIYTFHSTQAGTIQFGGSCGDGTPVTAIEGNNTVTYSLTNGQTYSDCQIRVLNANIEASNILALGTFTVNTGSNAPVITEVTPISNPSTTVTPSYVFHSTQAGTIVYGGSCLNGDKVSATIGNNTVTYTLNDGQLYNDCVIQVINASNEGSNILSLGTFTINTGSNPPVIAEITAIPNPSTTTTPTYVFHSTQAGTIAYGGACGQGSVANATAGNNTVTYFLIDGQTYNDCTVQVVNASNEGSNVLSLGNFTVNTGSTAPIITEVTPIPNPSTTTTPMYVFHSTQAGTIVYGGICGNGDVANAVTGDNTIEYALANGQTYNDCTVRVVNANNEGSNILSLGTFTINTGANPPVIAEVTPISNPSLTTTPSYIFSSTQSGTIIYGGSCGNGDMANAIIGNNTVAYTLVNGQGYNDCTVRVINASNEGSNILSLGSFIVEEEPNPKPPVVYSASTSGSGKAGMRFSGQRRDDYARSGKFWDMSKSIADIERINQGYLGRVTTYINRNGFRVFAGYLPGRLSLDYLSSRIQRSHNFVYRGERDSRSGSPRRVSTKRQWETHPQTYFRNRWAHNAFIGIEKAVAFDPKEDSMKVQGGNTWTPAQWRRGGVWARDHVSVNSNYNTNKVVTPLPVYLPRLSININKKALPVSLGIRRVNLQYTVAKGVSRVRPVVIESAASPAYEMYVTDLKEPWANDRFFNRRETLETYPGDGTAGQRTIRIEQTLNPAYGAVIETSQQAWERSFLKPEKAPANTFGRVNTEFVRPDNYTYRVPTIDDKTGRRYDTEVERWRAYRIQKAERTDPWERRPYGQIEGRGVDRVNG